MNTFQPEPRPVRWKNGLQYGRLDTTEAAMAAMAAIATGE
jgi:hypothetical protein